MGRKKIDIDYRQLDKLLALQSTLKECAYYFNCSEDTIERCVKRDKGISFKEYRDLKKQAGLISLRRNQFQLSEKNAAMAIFLGKNYLGQKDSIDSKVDITHNNPFLGLSTDELRKLASDDEED